MASLRELRKRLQSVKTTGQLAGAMRTVSTAKYSRASAQLSGLTAYSDALGELYGDIGGTAAPVSGAVDPNEMISGERPMLVLAAGNRGLCGGYNHKLFA